MGTRATGSFEMASWEEQPYSESEGGSKLTRASVTNAFHGDIEGEGTLAYLMAYREDGSGNFVGLEQVVGHVGGRAGSFVLQHGGTFAGDTIEATWFVVRGSGAGELHGLRGEGGFVARHGQRQTAFTLDYDLA